MKPGSTPSSPFSDQFLDVTWNKKAKYAGSKIQGLASELSSLWPAEVDLKVSSRYKAQNLQQPMKLVVGLLIVSLLMEYYEIKSIFAVLPFLFFAIGMLVFMGKKNGHRIKHPSGLPNPFFKGFFLSTVLACFLSFYINLLLRPIFREDGHFKSSLIFCIFLHVCMAKATKEVLTAHPFKLPQSTTSQKPNAALQRIIDQDGRLTTNPSIVNYVTIFSPQLELLSPAENYTPAKGQVLQTHQRRLSWLWPPLPFSSKNYRPWKSQAICYLYWNHGAQPARIYLCTVHRR